MMTHNGPSLQDRFTREADRTPWMASRPGEPADSMATDVLTVAFAIAVLLIIGFLASCLP
jgi:hypothetical protein